MEEANQGEGEPQWFLWLEWFFGVIFGLPLAGAALLVTEIKLTAVPDIWRLG